MNRNGTSTGISPVRILRAVLSGGALVFVFLDLGVRNQSGALADFGGPDWTRRVLTPGDLIFNLSFLGGALLLLLGWMLFRKKVHPKPRQTAGWDAAVENWSALSASLCIAAVSLVLYYGSILAYHRLVDGWDHGGCYSGVYSQFPPRAIMAAHISLLLVFALTAAGVFALLLRDMRSKGHSPLPDRIGPAPGPIETFGSIGRLFVSAMPVLLPLLAGASTLLVLTDLLLRCDTALELGRFGGGGSVLARRLLSPVFGNIPLAVSLAATGGWLVLSGRIRRSPGLRLTRDSIIERWGLPLGCAYAAALFALMFWKELTGYLDQRRFLSRFPFTDVVFPSNMEIATRFLVITVLGLAAVSLVILVFRTLRAHDAPTSNRRIPNDLV